MSHDLSEKWITIGRADGNTFQIAEASVSGRHCEARLRDGELDVRDLQSTNGTFVNGQKVSEASVKPGQTFRLGEVELRFEATSEQPATVFTSKMLTSATAALTAPKPAPSTVPVVETKNVNPAAADTDASKKFTVLFVDDSMAFLETFTDLCEVLSNNTWAIQCATSADRALAILQDGLMDLVVLDVGMPMVDGLQLLGIINRRYPGLKIAVMTGSATEANAPMPFPWCGIIHRKTGDAGRHQVGFQHVERLGFVGASRRFYRRAAAGRDARAHPDGMYRPPFLDPRNPQC